MNPSERTDFIGASEVPALFGLDPFMTEDDLYQKKVDPPVEDEPKPKSAMWYGNHLELAIGQMIMKIIDPGQSSAKLQPVYEHEMGVLRATCDMVLERYIWRKKLIDESLIVEIKTTGFAGAPMEHSWGRAGTDKIPMRVMLQVQAQMACSNIPCVCVGLLNGHNAKGLQLYYVKYDNRIGREIINKVHAFWKNHILCGKPPGERTQ